MAVTMNTELIMTKNAPQKKVAKTIEEAQALGLTEIEVEVSQEVHDKLNELKRPGESYSDIIRRMLAVIDAPPQNA